MSLKREICGGHAVVKDARLFRVLLMRSEERTPWCSLMSDVFTGILVQSDIKPMFEKVLIFHFFYKGTCLGNG